MIYSIVDAYPFNTSDPVDLERRRQRILKTFPAVKIPPPKISSMGGGVVSIKPLHRAHKTKRLHLLGHPA